MKRRSHDLTRAGLMVVLLMLSSWLSVPAPVPFTLQTFAVACALLLLGPRLSAAALTAYLLLGALGVPVFASFGAGFSQLLGPSGGYFWGFLAMSGAFGLSRKLRQPPAFSLALGLLCCYLCGMFWYAFAYLKQGLSGLPAAFFVGVLPFLLPDILKLSLAIWLCKMLKKHLK